MSTSITTRSLGALSLITGLTLFALLGWLSTQHPVSIDISRHHTGRLSPTTTQLLRQLEAPLALVAVVADNPVLHRKIKKFAAPYLQESNQITLQFTTPEKAAVETGESLNQEGRLELHYRGRTEKITTLNEQDMVRALHKLLHNGENWIVFLEGHEEKSPFDDSANGYSKLNLLLQRQGYRTQAINLLKLPAIPDNTAVLVIAGPLSDLLPGEEQLVTHYLQQGGNLLLLREPKALPEFDTLIKALGITPLSGVVITLNNPLQKLLKGLHPAIIPITDFGKHPATRGLKSKLLLPIASAFTVTPADHWQYTTLFESLPGSWNETSDLKGHVRFDANTEEKAGPLPIGIAASRTHHTQPQLTTVIGDSDFLSNEYLGLGDNARFMLQLLDWLTTPEFMNNQAPRPLPDLDLGFSEVQLQILAAGFLFGIPLLLSLIAFRQWRQQNKHRSQN